MQLEDANKLVISAVSDYLKELQEDLDVELEEVTMATRLFGANGVLDSVGVVILLTELEERLEVEFGVEISLATDTAMSSARSPFRNVSTLASYLLQALAEES